MIWLTCCHDKATPNIIPCSSSHHPPASSGNIRFPNILPHYHDYSRLWNSFTNYTWSLGACAVYYTQLSGPVQWVRFTRVRRSDNVPSKTMVFLSATVVQGGCGKYLVPWSLRGSLRCNAGSGVIIMCESFWRVQCSRASQPTFKNLLWEPPELEKSVK